MQGVNSGSGLRLFQSLVVVAFSAVLPSSAQVLAQATATPPASADVHAQHAAQSNQANQELARQVAELRAQVAALQDALAAKHQVHLATQPATGGTRPMMPGRTGGSSAMGMGMGGMGRMASGMGGMGGMSGGTGAGMGAMTGGAGVSGSGMGMMGGMSGMPGMGGGGMTAQGMAGMSDVSGGVEAMKPDEMMGQMMQNMGEMMQMMGQMQGNGMSTMGGMGDKQKMGMGKMKGMRGMGMMSGMGGGMGGMTGMGSGGTMGQAAGGMPGGMGMGMMGGEMGMMKGMMGMGPMLPATGQMSALPGFPGASHIYHIGATGFFLDHPGHITLTPEQQMRLNQIRESALLEQATLQRQIDEAEQELWQLTASDTPDAAKIETKTREIAKLQADQRIAFIQAVGEAAGVLTEDQRKQLTGMLPPARGPAAQPAQPSGIGSGGAMGDM